GNVSKVFSFGKHDLTVYGIGYYGFAFQPGLIPIDRKTPGDTYDARQQEETSNGSLILNDIWHLTPQRQLQFSGFYRYYTLDVRPNFGDGLIRQSEHRNVNAEDLLYAEHFNSKFSLLAGADFRREQPSALDLDHINEAGRFDPVTANNILLNFYSPFVSADGAFLRFLHYNIGYRRDEIGFDNQDLRRPDLSFSRHASISSPKGTISLLPPEPVSAYLPSVSLSYGQAFHVNDPRIGTTALEGGTIVSKARSYQLAVSKTIARTDFRVILAHITTAQQLARISNDTGLQQDEGPGLLKSITVTARHNFAHGFIQALYARADARDRITGEPTPEAPRLIWDLLGTADKLPFHLVARGEYEHVGIKPLGGGFLSVPVREFRGALLRPFESKGIDVGLNVFIASGYGGQTVETLALPGEGDPFDRVTGFPLRSSISASVTYRFRRGAAYR
ncbi:MAG: TonB-dependent receptor, partial [Acidobacteriota bacterium]|nr:TonB-dependent receptor [Acidobacteriota bacterium]